MKKLVYWLLGGAVSWFAIYMTEDFFLLSFSAIVFALPLWLIVEAAYIVISCALKRKIFLVFSWCDFPVICLSISTWGYVVSIEPMGLPCKSLANLVETGLFTLFACILYAIRCYHAFRGNVKAMDRWMRISAIAVPIVAVLFALLFPCLPE